ncbi:MAG: CDP-alcohol phosphatidyltransferase family protein [Proteobacteria bacterium]|nr:CDP-alcohol phosphatidyltransferase family protein [Pseudomonadota bacterium]
MTFPPRPRRPASPPPRLLAGALAAFAAGLAGTALAGFALAAATGLGWAAPAAGIAILASLSAVALAGLRAHLPEERFGAANAVTLARAALASLIGGLALAAGAIPPALAWSAAGAGAAAFLLDALDGRLARALGRASAFGARFDAETDALLILALSALLARSGRAGAWVLAAGLLRYLFLGAGLALPWLRARLSPSRRRSAACALATACLVAASVPAVPSAAPAWLAGAGLMLLLLSFAIDVARLAARPRGAPDASPG